MAYYSYNVNAFSLPFANIENKVLFKLFMVDPGLVCYMSLSGRQFEVMNGTIDVNEVALSEEFVAAELSKKGIDLHLNLAQRASDHCGLTAEPHPVEGCGSELFIDGSMTTVH